MEKNPNLTLSAADLSALLASRICHDVVNPIGASSNGLELLDEGGMDEDALNLIRQSTLSAATHLKFARLAFGASGTLDTPLDTGEAETAVRDLIGLGKRITLNWVGPRISAPKDRVKLLLNLVLIAQSSIPRGGTIDVGLDAAGDIFAFIVRARGNYIQFPTDFSRIYGGVMDDPITSHNVQAYYTALMAEEADMNVEFVVNDGEVVFEAKPVA
ncbi:histidine phosphotransferase family protein [Martelella mediterranea]|uniref:Histidine phosphotransferase ChpT n=1 Tax=Martelella mediterranea TaxID=293089 RepID=A0A4R3NZP5_9HYPH|nr:histidine phosphotransferase family protein [Martelella mediterranea]TCT45073.1 histidine phosphotransferase ChpT [Martelella mediterranea]